MGVEGERVGPGASIGVSTTAGAMASPLGRRVLRKPGLDAGMLEEDSV
jgi:hypothetical protein